MKKLLKIILIVIIAIIIIFGAVYLFISTPKKVDTKWTEKDYNDFIQKTGIDSNVIESGKLGIADILNGDFSDINPKELNNVTISAPEIAAFVSKQVKPDIISDFNIAFKDNTIILTFKVGKSINELETVLPEIKPYESYIKLAIGKPVYLEFTDEKATDKTFRSTTKAFYVGQLELPQSQVQSGLNDLRTSVNNALTKFNNFRVDKYSISKDGINFTGIIPTKINLK